MMGQLPDPAAPPIAASTRNQAHRTMPIDAPAQRLEAHGSALADEVYELLAQAILDGRLAAGERLRDVEIAELYGISRTPVREAIQRLERQGLVEVAAHRYTRVSTPDESAQAEATEFIGRLTGTAASLAMLRASDEQIAQMLTELDAVIDACGRDDDRELMARMVAFHRSATIASGNKLLINVVREVNLPVQRVVGGWRPFGGDHERCVDSFRRLRVAVAARDEVLVEQIVREQHPLA
jgi:DNA-binding GntR family transcriptional regulator